jgi:hypothetical protein
MIEQCPCVQVSEGVWRCPDCGFEWPRRFLRECPARRAQAARPVVPPREKPNAGEDRSAVLIAWHRRAIFDRWAGLGGQRTEAEIDAILDRCAQLNAWPCGGCPDKLDAWITEAIWSDRWRPEWGPRPSVEGPQP